MHAEIGFAKHGREFWGFKVRWLQHVRRRIQAGSFRLCPVGTLCAHFVLSVMSQLGGGGGGGGSGGGGSAGAAAGGSSAEVRVQLPPDEVSEPKPEPRYSIASAHCLRMTYEEVVDSVFGMLSGPCSVFLPDTTSNTVHAVTLFHTKRQVGEDSKSCYAVQVDPPVITLGFYPEICLVSKYFVVVDAYTGSSLAKRSDAKEVFESEAPFPIEFAELFGERRELGQFQRLAMRGAGGILFPLGLTWSTAYYAPGDAFDRDYADVARPGFMRIHGFRPTVGCTWSRGATRFLGVFAKEGKLCGDVDTIEFWVPGDLSAPLRDVEFGAYRTLIAGVGLDPGQHLKDPGPALSEMRDFRVAISEFLEACVFDAGVQLTLKKPKAASKVAAIVECSDARTKAFSC